MVAVRVAYSRVRAHSRRSSSKRCNSSLVRPVAETRVTVVVAEISAVVTEVALVVTEAARDGIGNSNRSGSSNSKLPVPFPKRESMRLHIKTSAWIGYDKCQSLQQVFLLPFHTGAAQVSCGRLGRFSSLESET